jgi:hypothetical protein
MRHIEAFLTSPTPITHAQDGAVDRGAPRVGAEGSDLVCRRLPDYPTSPSALVEKQAESLRLEVFRKGFDIGCGSRISSMEWSHEGL